MRAQAPIREAEVRGRPGFPFLIVDGVLVDEGTDLQGRFGFAGRLSGRMLRVLALLALRRVYGGSSGWMSADEIGVLAGDGDRGRGIAKMMERELEEYSEPWTELLRRKDDDLPSTHLIQYALKRPVLGTRGGWRGGRSRGPYRLAGEQVHLRIDPRGCWEALLGTTIAIAVPPHRDDEIADLRRTATSRGDLVGARMYAAHDVQRWYRRESAVHDRADLLAGVGAAWDALANLDMELGLSRASVEGAERSRRFFDAARHPLGVTHA